MKSHATERFRKMLQQLPEPIKRQAREAYKLFKQNPHHPSLRFKQVHSAKPIYSVRINIDFRAVGTRNGNEIIWFWIGSHTDYEKLISRV